LASHRDVVNVKNAGVIFGQKKASKEKATLMPFEFCVPKALVGGVERASSPCKNEHHPCRALVGQNRSKPPVLGAATGEENPSTLED